MSIRTAHDLDEKWRSNDIKLDENADFSALMLSDRVLKGLKKAGFKNPSPIQLKAIPLGRCGLDLVVQAKSGTGKTCVFTVIALENLLDVATTQVLILSPTREIAAQICDVVNSIGSCFEDLKCCSFIGGLPLIDDQKNCKNCQIAVGTPGRLRQLIGTSALKVESIRLFVLDEADKLLEESFLNDLNWIFGSLPDNKQVIAASATYPKKLAQIVIQYMRNPSFVRLNIDELALLGLVQYYCVTKFHPIHNINYKNKFDVLWKILNTVKFSQCLIFCNLITRVETLCNDLNAWGFPTTSISSNQEQEDRLEAIQKLKTFQSRVLVTSDLVSRGIDAENVDFVINLDLPYEVETYLHRIGRAGRYGSRGIAISLVPENELHYLLIFKEKSKLKIYSLPDPLPSNLSNLEPDDSQLLPSNGNELENSNNSVDFIGSCSEKYLEKDFISNSNSNDVFSDYICSGPETMKSIVQVSNGEQTTYDNGYSCDSNVSYVYYTEASQGSVNGVNSEPKTTQIINTSFNDETNCQPPPISSPNLLDVDITSNGKSTQVVCEEDSKCKIGQNATFSESDVSNSSISVQVKSNITANQSDILHETKTLLIETHNKQLSKPNDDVILEGRSDNSFAEDKIGALIKDVSHDNKDSQIQSSEQQFEKAEIEPCVPINDSSLIAKESCSHNDVELDVKPACKNPVINKIIDYYTNLKKSAEKINQFVTEKKNNDSKNIISEHDNEMLIKDIFSSISSENFTYEELLSKYKTFINNPSNYVASSISERVKPPKTSIILDGILQDLHKKRQEFFYEVCETFIDVCNSEVVDSQLECQEQITLKTETTDSKPKEQASVAISDTALTGLLLESTLKNHDLNSTLPTERKLKEQTNVAMSDTTQDGLKSVLKNNDLNLDMPNSETSSVTTINTQIDEPVPSTLLSSTRIISNEEEISDGIYYSEYKSEGSEIISESCSVIEKDNADESRITDSNSSLNFDSIKYNVPVGNLKHSLNKLDSNYKSSAANNLSTLVNVSSSDELSQNDDKNFAQYDCIDEELHFDTNEEASVSFDHEDENEQFLNIEQISNLSKSSSDSSESEAEVKPLKSENLRSVKSVKKPHKPYKESKRKNYKSNFFEKNKATKEAKLKNVKEPEEHYPSLKWVPVHKSERQTSSDSKWTAKNNQHNDVFSQYQEQEKNRLNFSQYPNFYQYPYNHSSNSSFPTFSNTMQRHYHSSRKNSRNQRFVENRPNHMQNFNFYSNSAYDFYPYSSLNYHKSASTPSCCTQNRCFGCCPSNVCCCKVTCCYNSKVKNCCCNIPATKCDPFFYDYVYMQNMLTFPH